MSRYSKFIFLFISFLLWTVFFLSFCALFYFISFGETASVGIRFHYCLLLKPVSQQKGSVTEKNPGEGTQCLLFLLLWQNHGDLWWIPQSKSGGIPEGKAYEFCLCLSCHSPQEWLTVTVCTLHHQHLSEQPLLLLQWLPPLGLLDSPSLHASGWCSALQPSTPDRSSDSSGRTRMTTSKLFHWKRMREGVFCLTSFLTLMFIRISGFSASVNFSDIHF